MRKYLKSLIWLIRQLIAQTCIRKFRFVGLTPLFFQSSYSIRSQNVNSPECGVYPFSIRYKYKKGRVRKGKMIKLTWNRYLLFNWCCTLCKRKGFRIEMIQVVFLWHGKLGFEPGRLNLAIFCRLNARSQTDWAVQITPHRSKFTQWKFQHFQMFRHHVIYIYHL